jgi:3-dehydroquinate synthase
MSYREIQVNLGDRSYPIIVGYNARYELPGWLEFVPPGTMVAVVTSPHVGGLYGDDIVANLNDAGFDAWVAEMPDGERQKTLATAGLLYDQFADRRMERGSLVVGDVAGFVAATYMRGIPFMQMPTSFIAQVDAGIGGKVAVDHRRGKNLIGAFYQPKLVVVDVGTLETLSERHYRAGIPEVLRYGVIASPSLFETLETQMEAILQRDPEVLTQIVTTSCSIKAHIVEQDETESGLRATLNYGHTFAHAIEAATEYKEFLHGEAVGLGELCAAEMAATRGLVERAFCDRQRAILASAGLPTHVPKRLNVARVVEAMFLDKKVVGGRIRYIVPTAIGAVEIRDDFSPQEAQAAIEALQ